MRIFLINPDSGIEDLVGKHYAPYAVPVPPAGIASLAGRLKAEGHQVTCYDAYAHRPGNKALLRMIHDSAPDIVGFSCLTLAMKNVAKLCVLLKESGSKTKIVLGNAHVSVLSRQTLENGTGDIIVRGEAEETMAELVHALADQTPLFNVKGISFRDINGEIVETPDRSPIDNLDKMPFPVWNDFDLSIYKAAALPLTIFEGTRPLPVLASRGCPYSCEFCAQDYAFKGVRLRSLESVIEEIIYLHEEYECNCVGFLDACFPLSESQGLEFCRLFRARGLHKRIKWFCETRVNLVNKNLLLEMSRAGCKMVQYGFESGNQAILDTIRKKSTLKQAELAVEYTRKAGMLAYGLFMLGNRGETSATCMETIRFARKLGCDLAKFNLVVPYPGSPLFNRYLTEREDHQSDFTDRFTGFFDLLADGSEPLFVPEGMTAAELIHLQKKAMLSFYLRPGLISRYLIHRIVSLREMIKGGYILLHDIVKSRFAKRPAHSEFNPPGNE